MPTLPYLLDWAAQHPLTSFMLACPAALVLCVTAWCIASAITNTWAVLCGTVQALASVAVVVVRGYPPPPPTLPEPPDDEPRALAG